MRPETAAPVTAPENVEARQAWDGADGDYWVEHEATFDHSLAAYGPTFRAATAIAPTDRVVDVGCGTGETTRDAARAATGGAVLGLDLSSTMLERAAARASEQGLANVSFVQADAQVYPFEPASFDVAISRTGAMFFGDPLAAFTNLARALRPGGRLAMLVWQGLEHNEWLGAFRRALAAGRDLPSPPVGAPGPFALADPVGGEGLLGKAGFTAVMFTGHRAPMWFGEDTDAAFAFVRGLGFTDFMLRDLDEPARTGALDALRASIAEHATADGVVYASGAWLVSARRP